MSADCIGTGCAKESLLARVRELEAERDAVMALSAQADRHRDELLAEIKDLRALLTEHRDFPNAGDAEAFRQWHEDWCARRDAALGTRDVPHA